MDDAPQTPSAPRRRPAASIPVTGPVSFMHPDDVGKVHVPASQRESLRVVPDYNRGEDGVDTVKVLLVTPTTVMMEASRPKGAKDRAHMHPDHDAYCYQKKGRVKMRIGEQWFIVAEGDSYFHPMGVIHQHEALEDSVRIEVKNYPRGGAIESWNALAGVPDQTDAAGPSHPSLPTSDAARKDIPTKR